MIRTALRRRIIVVVEDVSVGGEEAYLGCICPRASVCGCCEVWSDLLLLIRRRIKGT